MKIEIFSTPQCGYCDVAKKLLDEKGLAYTILDVMSDPAVLADFQRRLPRAKAVPQIFIDGKHVGGWRALTALIENGEVEALLGP